MGFSIDDGSGIENTINLIGLTWSNTVFKYLCLILHYFYPVMLGCPFFARGKVNHRRVCCRIVAGVYAVAMKTADFKQGFKKCFFLHLKKIQSFDFSHHLPTKNLHKIPSVNTALMKFLQRRFS